MRRIISLVILLAAAAGCTKETSLEGGQLIGEINVTAASGSVSVSVETTGRWKVYEAEESGWIGFDVEGGVGKGAFTVYYESNMSDVVTLKSSRKALIVIASEDHMKADTLSLVQQGFHSVHAPSEVGSDKDIVIEFEEHEATEVSVVFCSADGLDSYDELKAWAISTGCDVVACENAFLVPQMEESILKTGDLNIVTADLSAFAGDGNAEHEAFVNLVESTYNSPSASSRWIIGGQFFHYSMMQSGYDRTPSWYPENPEDSRFASDRYAWNNNLYDCVWMTYRDYVSTYSAGGKEYMADYIYVSRDVLATVYSVEVLDKPLPGMKHNPLKVTLKY